MLKGARAGINAFKQNAINKVLTTTMKAGSTLTGAATAATAASRQVGGFYKHLAHNTVGKKVLSAGTFLVGASAMASVSMMNGGMQAAQQQLASRYMQDSRYSSKLLQSRIGRAAGNSSLNIGNHTGLSLSMHRSRHG